MTLTLLQIKQLKSLVVSRESKAEIFALMAATRSKRQKWITEFKPSVTSILEEFPKFKKFSGALVIFLYSTLSSSIPY